MSFEKPKKPVLKTLLLELGSHSQILHMDMLMVMSLHPLECTTFSESGQLITVSSSPILFILLLIHMLARLSHSSQGIESGTQPPLNLKGYLIGNPGTGEAIDLNSRIPYAHNMGIISDELYESTIISCEGEDYESPTNTLCAEKLRVAKKFINEIQKPHILEPKCPRTSPNPRNLAGERRFLKDEYEELIIPPPVPPLKCRTYAYYLSYIWANTEAVRDALHIQKGTVPEWIRCNDNLQYAKDIPSSVKYQHKLTSQGYRALVYSGDHDMLIPHIGTQTWIRSLNYSIVDDWRSWFSSGQVAGYTRTYAHNLTLATIKGAGHTAPEYKPRESLDMIKRWFSYQPL